MRYLNKVVFINSANVKYAEVAIDGNVHFIGTQGVGKSTLLRAILFFYNADKLKLGIEKGKKTFDEYYFPFGNSYLIYEITRETGTYCIMAFKAQGRACFRFINAAYDKGNFVSEEGKVKTWEGIRDSFGKKTNYTRKIDRYEEFRDILYGNTLGIEKEFRKYALIESKQYQNIPRTIQNVFLNSKLDAEFIKQTIIMSLNEEDVKIELDKYALHLKDFDAQLADINKWTDVQKSGDIPVRKMAEKIATIHAAIQSLTREKQDAAIRLFAAYEKAAEELPLTEKECGTQQRLKETAQQKADALKEKFRGREKDIQSQITILDSNIKTAKKQAEFYESIDINTIIQRVSKEEDKQTEKELLLNEKMLLNAKFTEINSRYQALIQQQQNAFAIAENIHQAHKNKVREDFLQTKGDIEEQYSHVFAEIRKQHQDALELARNSIAQKKDTIHGLELKKQKIQLQRYFEQDIEATKAEIAELNQKIKSGGIDIADLKKQSETLQKQWELELEKSNAIYNRKVEKMRDEATVFTTTMDAIDAKLQKNKDSLYGWLSSNVPGWEENIGKVLDEEGVLFQEGLSPEWTPNNSDSVFGLKVDLQEINKKVKTLADYQQDRLDAQQKKDENWNAQRATIAERDSEEGKLKSRYQSRIREINNTRRQTEYELQRSKGQLQTNEVKLEDLHRNAAAEKVQLLNNVKQEIEAASEELLTEEKNLSAIDATMQKQLDNKEKERNRKIKAEDNTAKEQIATLETELEAKKLEAEDRISEIQQQQTEDLQKEGADVPRIAAIEREMIAIQRELDYIKENRSKVFDYNKDKRELFDHVDTFKAEKRVKEKQMANEQEKYNLQKQTVLQEIEELSAAIRELNNRLDKLNEGLSSFKSFKQTDNYLQIAAFEGQPLSGTDIGGSDVKALIDSVNGKIYTIQERYTDMQGAINKFTSEFTEKNIFGFKSKLTERNEFLEFSEMLYEFMEEDKIAMYEKRVNEQFATLIRQIGRETNDLTSKAGEIQKVIAEINRDFEERNFAGVIKSIKLQVSDSRNTIVSLLQDIKKFNDEHSMSLGVVDLFSGGDNDAKNKKAVSLLKEFAKEINSRKEKEISLPDSFELQFRIVENENDSGWVEKLTNVGSEGTDILVKAMINIMLLNVFKDSASKRFKDFRLHCMMDEIGKLHPNNVKGILKFANDRNILLINSSPTSYNATDYRYTYLLSKDSKHVTTVKRLIKKGAEA